MPATAAGLGVKDSFQPDQNVRGGSAYFDALLTRYHDNLALALANGGASVGGLDADVYGPNVPLPALAITWLGHATTLIEVDGRYVLTDPVWGDRVSPSRSIVTVRRIVGESRMSTKPSITTWPE